MKLQALADALQLKLTGDPDHSISCLRPVDSATADALSFVVGKAYAEQLQQTKAGAVILPEALASFAPGNYLVSDNPYLSYARASQLLYPDSGQATGIHPTAVVSDSAIISPSASIGANVVIEDEASVGADSVIGAGCFVGAKAVIGERSRLFANVTIYHDCTVGNDCRFQSGVVVGSDGFGYAPGPGGWERINQVGIVAIGDRVEIGANTTIDRGAMENTVIEDGVILDNQIQVAHNVRIGSNTAIAGCVGIAGSTQIGKNCRIGGKTAIVGHIQISDNVTLTATSFVSRSIREPGVYSSGMPLQRDKLWRRTFARLNQLDDLARGLKRLEKKSR